MLNVKYIVNENFILIIDVLAVTSIREEFMRNVKTFFLFRCSLLSLKNEKRKT